ncbi:uracil-DNA glycosylase [Rhodobacterales bacterium HKCCSP123]|nr:uracil-DNA glycosylase [Rhodobacterales bacterium HKCCSP123]
MDELGYHDALAMLDWQIELGADEAILDAPVDRFALEDQPRQAAASVPAAAPASTPTAQPSVPQPVAVDAAEVARAAASAATDLASLRAAIEAFAYCPLRETAKQLVFADGNPSARVMIVGEAPGREEDLQGKPFVGRAGQLLDRMLAAIGMDRRAEDPAHAVYITNMLPWRPPQNRDPTPEELAMLGPFIRRHIELADPDILVLMGNWACQGMMGTRGITRLRGGWVEVMGRPAIPMFHPAYLLRKPHDKAKAWQDLLSLQARLRSIP